jgi:Tol biopolymer transport system component/DNA-binding winged helix-turn-helix (wHTH) protein
MLKQTKQLYEFGPFRLDVDERLLVRDGRMTPLPPKVFDTLLVLVENSGRVVSKDELMQSLWPDTFVEESNLTQNISQLRRALGDGTAGAQYIETIPKRGYRFVASVQSLAVNGISEAEAIAVNGHAPAPAADPADQSDGLEQTLSPAVEVTTEKLSRKRFVAVATLMAFSAAIVVLALIVASRRAGKAGTAFQQATLIKLTASGKVFNPAISHDGKFVAYATEDGDLQSLWVRQLASNSSAQIVAPAEVIFVGVTFSHDDNLIYYVARRKGEEVNKLYQVPLLGGAPREIMAGVDSPVTFSPNGQYFAFVRNYLTERETALIVVKHDGSEERKLLTRKRPETLSRRGPSWSPDGRMIACTAGVGRQGETSAWVLAVNVEDGSSAPIGSQTWTFVGQVAWLGDGSGLVISAWQRRWGVYGDQIWLLTFPEGKTRPVTKDLNNYESVSVSTNLAEPGAIITQRMDRVSRISIVSKGSDGFGAERSAQIQSGFSSAFSEGFGLDWTPDERLVYGSQASGNLDVWITTADGKHQKQLTRDAQIDFMPVVTPDGRHIVFASERAGGGHIWRMDLDGGDLKQLTRGKNDSTPTLSPDGRWVIYTSYPSGGPSLWKVSIDGGEPTQLSAASAGRPWVSPDGKWIACYYQDQKDGNFKVALMPFAGGEPTLVEGLAQPELFVIRWSPDSSALTYIATQQGVSNIWSKPIDGGPARQLTNFTTDRIFRFAWSRDGKFLACERGIVINDAVLISEGQPHNLSTP